MNDIKQNAIQNLEDIKNILDSFNVNFWLDGGTLLGAYRDKDFPEGDEDDVDLGCFYKDVENKIDKIISEAEKLGFVLYHRWKYQVALKRGGNKIDIFYNRRFNDKAVYFIYKGVKEVLISGLYEKDINGNLWLCIPTVTPVKYLDELGAINFYGMEFDRPSRIEEYLTLKYGDWKIKVSRKEYSNAGGCYNPEVFKILNNEFFY